MCGNEIIHNGRLVGLGVPQPQYYYCSSSFVSMINSVILIHNRSMMIILLQGNYLWLKASPCFPTLNTTNKGPANEWTQRQTRVLLGNVQYIITVQMKQKTALIVIGHVNYGDDDSHCLLSPGKGLGRARWAMPAMPSQKNGGSSKGTYPPNDYIYILKSSRKSGWRCIVLQAIMPI